MSATALRTFEAYKDCTERRDADGVLTLFTDDAVLLEYDRDHPPKNPGRFEGRASIETMLRDVYGRDMTHRIRDEVIGDDRFACVEECQYPDGNRVFAQILCKLRDGKIEREELSQAWDE
jgi:ketosteroid isomerase-like protein